ncbi:hypothetical protein Tco_0750353 [Tanacetum coccineum]|uniref:Integrase, catalytic region, zinc finger, CCHC-type, peptidase aspartic, catalytic n=1 Tax=Tanacetum coccineum TaxID=301880 RepID=A0ABQ4Z3S4_9ASTR
MSPLQINTKFLNHLQPEWKRFVIGVKQSKDLHKISYDQLFAYLKQNQDDAYEIRAERAARSHDPLALVSNTYNSTPYINPAPKYNQQVYMLYNNLMLHNNLWRYNNPMKHLRFKDNPLHDGKINDIAKRSDATMHSEAQDELMHKLKVAEGEKKYGMKIPDVMLNEDTMKWWST